MSVIHGRADATSLGLLRMVVFLLWAIIPIWEQAPRMTDLPSNAFSPPSFLAGLPAAAQDVLLSEIGLWLITISIVVMCFLVAIGAYPHRWFSLAAVGLIVLYQGVVRGFSGHINHAELVLLYIAIALLFFPIYDGLVMKGRSHGPQKPAAHYRAGFVVAMIILTASFSFTGAARISEGFGLFTGDTLANIVLERQVSNMGLIADATITLPWYMRPEYLWIPRLGYALTTLGELVAPLALVHRASRMGFVAFALSFHLLNWVWLGVTFFENLVLLMIFSEHWFHRAASCLGKRQFWSATRGRKTAIIDSF